MIKYLEKANNFKDIINQATILVDFYADWCGPCKMFDKVLEQVDFIDILKINVDVFSDIAKEYGIMSIPTICYFKDGILKMKKIGLQSIDNLLEDIKKL